MKKLLDYHNIFNTKTIKVIMQKTVLLLLDISISDQEKAKYLAKIGLIIYAIVKIQIDIAFATFIVS